MPVCIYCAQEKPASEISLEHVIPRFLGGAYAPERFRARLACSRCNSLLGQFVDGSYARSWFISNWLAQSALACYTSENRLAVPLICMGPTALNPPDMALDEICEQWLGPRGELVFWVRPKDDNFYWYVGGNPTTAKSRSSRAYFFFNNKTPEDPLMTWISFREAFQGQRVQKIMGTKVIDTDFKEIGFVDADEVDGRRIAYFLEAVASSDSSLRISLGMNVMFDYRFMAKLGLGFGQIFLGSQYLTTECCRELRNGIWDRGAAEVPLIRGKPTFSENADPHFLHFSGVEYAVTITTLMAAEGLALNLNIGTKHVSSVLCADNEFLETISTPEFAEGSCVVLFPCLKKSFVLSLPEFVAFRLGRYKFAELSDIEKQIRCNLQRLRVH